MGTMDLNRQDVQRRPAETDPEQRGLIAREQAIIAREEAIIGKAEADIDAGLGIEDDEVEAWLDRLDHDPDAPIPSPDRGPAVR